jgi:hypothetical protein
MHLPAQPRRDRSQSAGLPPAGDKDTAEFSLELGGRFLHMRYFAVRDADGAYRGVVETAQDVTDIRSLEGQRRLLDWYPAPARPAGTSSRLRRAGP